jgi:hypothetical protein
MGLKERPGGKPSGPSRVDQYLPRSSIKELRDAIYAERLLATQTSRRVAKARVDALPGGCLLYRPVWPRKAPME